MTEHTPRPDENLLSIQQAADRVGVSARTIWGALAPRGTLPQVRIGKSVRIDPRALAEWLSQQTVRA